VFGNSIGPALLFGGADAGLGRVILVLTLAVKPLTGLLAALGAPSLAAGALAVAIGAWCWWLLARPALGHVAPEAAP
jgi:hypothetical protein